MYFSFQTVNAGWIVWDPKLGYSAAMHTAAPSLVLSVLLALAAFWLRV